MESKIQLLSYGIKQSYNEILRNFSIKTGKNISKPINIYGTVTFNCVSKCIMCSQWKTDKDREELSSEKWIEVLGQLYEWLGTFHINFGGGEPLLKKGMLDMLDFCKTKGILAGMVSNGFLINERVANRLASSGLFNLNLSIDGVSSNTHDYLRGFNGAYQKVSKAVDYLIKAMEMNKSHLRIIIKPLITSINMHEIPDLIRWTRDKGLVGVNFSPVIKWTDNCDSLWINDSNALHKLVDELLKLKQQGYPIINDEDNIRMLIPYYLESETEGKTSGFNNINDIEQVDAKKCHVGYTNLFIRPRGDLQFCDLMPYFGNVKEGNIKDIWYSKEAENIRKMTLNCKKICLQPCVVKRSLKNKFEIMFKLLKK